MPSPDSTVRYRFPGVRRLPGTGPGNRVGGHRDPGCRPAPFVVPAPARDGAGSVLAPSAPLCVDPARGPPEPLLLPSQMASPAAEGGAGVGVLSRLVSGGVGGPGSSLALVRIPEVA